MIVIIITQIVIQTIIVFVEKMTIMMIAMIPVVYALEMIFIPHKIIWEDIEDRCYIKLL